MDGYIHGALEELPGQYPAIDAHGDVLKLPGQYPVIDAHGGVLEKLPGQYPVIERPRRRPGGTARPVTP